MEMKKYGLVRCSKKSGKVDMAMTGIGSALLQLWALQNTTKSKRTVVFELDTGLISSIYTGTPDGFPSVRKGIEEECLYVNDELRDAMSEG